MWKKEMQRHGSLDSAAALPKGFVGLSPEQAWLDSRIGSHG